MMAGAKKKAGNSKTTASKKASIQRALKTDMPGWELAGPAAGLPGLADTVQAPDVIGAGMTRLKQKYGGAGKKKPNAAKNGTLVRVKLKGSTDDAKSVKTALVHNGKVIGVQG